MLSRMVKSPSGLVTFLVSSFAVSRNSFWLMLYKYQVYKEWTLALSLVLVWAPGVLFAQETIVVVGDSLSSGYGVPVEKSWVAALADRLRAEGYGYQVINASIPGDTSAGGLARLPPLLEQHRPRILIIELGGNDGLRGQSVARLRDNLAAMIDLSREAGATVILAGMQIPPNYGETYTRAFSGVYPDLAQEFDIQLVDFLLDSVALDPTRMQSDGIHPNIEGHQGILENVWAVIAEQLE